MVVASFTQRGVEVGPAGGHISVGAMPRSYQVTSVGPSHPVPALLLEANPKAADAKRARHQVIRNQPPHLGTCHDDTPPIRQLHPDTETQKYPTRGKGFFASVVRQRTLGGLESAEADDPFVV